MSDYLAVIHNVLAEHQLLAERAQRVKESINDLEAVFSLDRVSSEWSQSSLDMLVDRQRRLQDNLGVLTSGIQRHFDFEEETLPPILGASLMQALTFEHQEIRDKTRACEREVAHSRLEALKRDAAFVHKGHVLQTIVDTRHAVAEHVDREEVILRMLERGLEKASRVLIERHVTP